MNEEMLKRLAGGVKSPEEVIAICKEYGEEITMEKAQEIFDKLNANKTGELSEDDLEAVAGGCDDDGGVFGPLLSWIGGLFGK